MKLTIFFLSILVVVLLIALGASFLLKGTTQPKAAAGTKEVKKDYFAKKVQCEEYGSKVKQRLDDEMYRYQTPGVISPIFGYENFMLVFYSPKLNTCIYTSKSIGENGNGSITAYDALTHQKIKNFPSGKEGEYTEFVNDYSGGEIIF